MTVKLGLVGTGTVGGGCIDILKNHREDFKRHYGIDVELVRVCSRNPEQAIEHGVEDIFTQDFHDILDDPDIDIVIELIGGTTVARDVVLGALRAGKNVVTANKALMATHGEEVMRTAEEAGKEIAFEASVGGGIPIIDPMKHSLIANRIDSVMGIVNGTTNYMLTRMAEDDMPYADVLAEAQAKGFAEADPTADVDGFDAASKVAILSSIAFHTRVTTDDVYMQGIRNVSAADIEQAREMGYCIKLLGIARKTAEGVDARVHPTMIPADHMLAGVSGAMNAVFAVGDAVGETMFYGAGAGSFPTASAVVGDVLELANGIASGIDLGPEPEPFPRTAPIRSIEDLETRYYIRLSVVDRVGTLAPVVAAFADAGVSISAINQLRDGDGTTCSVVFLTHTARERDVQRVCSALEALDEVASVASVIRIEDVDAWSEGAEENE